MWRVWIEDPDSEQIWTCFVGPEHFARREFDRLNYVYGGTIYLELSDADNKIRQHTNPEADIAAALNS